MSIDRTAWTAYGVTGIIDEPSDLLRESKVPAVIRTVLDDEDSDLETPMEAWLLARGVDGILAIVSGNSMSGVERWNLVVGRTITSVDESDPLEFIDMPTESELKQLAHAIKLLGIEDEPRWMMQMDIR
jgi:hypothetical protein